MPTAQAKAQSNPRQSRQQKLTSSSSSFFAPSSRLHQNYSRFIFLSTAPGRQVPNTLFPLFSSLNPPAFGPPVAPAHHRPVRSLREPNRHHNEHSATCDAWLRRDPRSDHLPRPRLFLRPLVQIDLLPQGDHAAGQILWHSHLWRPRLLLRNRRSSCLLECDCWI